MNGRGKKSSLKWYFVQVLEVCFETGLSYEQARFHFNPRPINVSPLWYKIQGVHTEGML